MKRAAPHVEWILLIHQLPPSPTGLRVRVWRKLQRLGAVAVKNSVYALPHNDKTQEDFQWLKQEVEAAGGEAIVLRAAAVDGATNAELVSTFQRARNDEYADIEQKLAHLASSVRSRARAEPSFIRSVSAGDGELERLHRELERIMAIDFFPSRSRQSAVAAYERCRHAVAVPERESRTPAAASSGAALDRAAFQGKRWVTRKGVYIDRLATIWLIKRFIDRRPRFSFVTEGEPVTDGHAFDMLGAELSHHDEDCTFETFIKRFGLKSDRALVGLGEIVHDIDLKDSKFSRTEAAGLAAIIGGLTEGAGDDRKRVAKCLPVFDGLYFALRAAAGADGEVSHGARPRRRPRERAPRRRR